MGALGQEEDGLEDKITRDRSEFFPLITWSIHTYSTFKLEEVSSDGVRSCKAGPFGALVPCLRLLLGLEVTSFPLMMAGDLETTFLLKHFLPAKQTLGKYLLWGFKVM